MWAQGDVQLLRICRERFQSVTGFSQLQCSSLPLDDFAVKISYHNRETSKQLSTGFSSNIFLLLTRLGQV